MNAIRIAKLVFKTALRSATFWSVLVAIPTAVTLLIATLSAENSVDYSALVLTWSTTLCGAILCLAGLIIGTCLIGTEAESKRFLVIKTQPVRPSSWLIGVWLGLTLLGTLFVTIATATIAITYGARAGWSQWMRHGVHVVESQAISRNGDILAPGETQTFSFPAKGTNWTLRIAFDALGGWREEVPLRIASGGSSWQIKACAGDTYLVPLATCDGTVQVTNCDRNSLATLFYHQTIPVALVEQGACFALNLLFLWLIGVALFSLWTGIGVSLGALFSKSVGLFIGMILLLLPLIAGDVLSQMPARMTEWPSWCITQAMARLASAFNRLHMSNSLGRGDLLNSAQTLWCVLFYGVILPLLALLSVNRYFRRREQ